VLALAANRLLQAQFTALRDGGWRDGRRLRPSDFVAPGNAYDNVVSHRRAPCLASGEVRVVGWTMLYLLISVTDPLVSTTADSLTNRDGVEFWIDHFNDKVAKFRKTTAR
jgi:hypothetical protein